MVNPKNQNSPNTVRPLRALALALLAALAPAAAAFELRDIQLASGPGQGNMQLSFSGGADGEYPMYFQKVDPARGTLTLSFLDTETAFPLGRHAVETGGPLVEEILLKRITSPSGKSFLGIEVRLKEPPAGEAPVQPQPKGTLKVLLGKADAGSKGRSGKPWSLAKALKSRDEYLDAKAAPSPSKAAPEVPNKVEAHPPEARSADGGSVPAPKVPESPSPGEASAAAGSSAPAGVPTTLQEIRVAVTRSQEDVTLVFDPPGSTPVHTVQAVPGDVTTLELTLDGVISGLARKDYALPGSALFKRVRTSRKQGNLVLRFQLASADPIHLLPREGALTLTGGGQGEAAVPFKWSSLKPDAAPPQSGAAAPVITAHQEGAAVDAASAAAGGASARKGKGLSSSRIFSLGQGGKSMILLKDSAALKSAPGPKAKTRRKIPVGEKVERLDREGAWIKVVSGPDTGYVRASEAAYEDEMTEAQLARHRQNLEAAAARAEAARIRAEKVAAREAEAAAQAAAALRKAEAGPLVEEAEPVRVAGPGAAPAASPIPEAGSPKGRKAADGPKLTLAETPELADKLAEEKKAAEGEKMRVQPGENRVAYNSYGRRDPFIPVEQGMADHGIDIDQMKVVGIIWQAQEPMAVLEHNKEAGVSFTVKQGDPVHNGRVSRITRDQVTFDISEYGISRSYSLKLVSNKEGKKQ